MTTTQKHSPNWQAYGAAVGHIRNREMLDNEYVALVMLFPGGKGTANMKKLVIQRSIDFIEVEDDRTEETKDRNQAGSS